MMNKNDVVAVIMGGPSAEREISLVTGAAIAGALREKGYNVAEIWNRKNWHCNWKNAVQK